MACNTLLLSDDGEFSTKPELEIFADDVVCGHGATVTEIDRNHLFYLMARGIEEKIARGLLVKAFVAEVIEELEDEADRRGAGSDPRRMVRDTWVSEAMLALTIPPSGLPAISPSRGEITLSSRLFPISNAARESEAAKLPISPLEGEMAGRPEGGTSGYLVEA